MKIDFKRPYEHLTDADFNGIISLLKKYKTFAEDINFENENTIEGKYGTYSLILKYNNWNFVNEVTPDGLLCNGEENTYAFGIELLDAKLPSAKYHFEYSYYVVDYLNLDVEDIEGNGGVNKVTGTLTLTDEDMLIIDNTGESRIYSFEMKVKIGYDV